MNLSLTLGLLTLVAADITVGVAPFAVLGLDEDHAVELRSRAQEHLAETHRNREVLSAQAIDEAIEALELNGDELRSCLLEETCAARIAREANADELLIGSAAGLGRTFELRLALVDAHRAVIELEVQQTVEGGPNDLSAAIGTQLDRLIPPPQPWYRRWWVWTIAATVLVSAAVVTTVLLLRPDDGQFDTYPLP